MNIVIYISKAPSSLQSSFFYLFYLLATQDKQVK